MYSSGTRGHASHSFGIGQRCRDLTSGPGGPWVARGEANLTRPDVSADIDAARMRIMHALYVGASRPRGCPALAHEGPAAVPPEHRPGAWRAGRNHPALGVRAAGRRLRGRPVRPDHHGEVLARPGGVGRLQETLIVWDIQAHCSLASAPTPANLLLVSRVEATVATTAGALAAPGTSTPTPSPPTRPPPWTPANGPGPTPPDGGRS
jgi:hypothetical protein